MKPLTKNFVKGLLKLAKKRTQEEFGSDSLPNFLETDMFDDFEKYEIASNDGQILLARAILNRMGVKFKIEKFDEENDQYPC